LAQALGLASLCVCPVLESMFEAILIAFCCFCAGHGAHVNSVLKFAPYPVRGARNKFVRLGRWPVKHRARSPVALDLGTLLTADANTFQTGGEKFAAALESVQGRAGPVLESVQSQAGPLLQKTGDAAAKALEVAMPAIQKGIVSATPVVQKTAEELAPVVKQGAEVLKPLLVAAGIGLGKTAVAAGTALGNTAVDAGGQLADQVSAALASNLDAWSARLDPALLEKIDPVLKTGADVATKARPVLDEAVQTATPYVEKAGEVATKGAADLLRKSLPSVRQYLDGIVGEGPVTGTAEQLAPVVQQGAETVMSGS